jgi:RNA polymerase sigma factor (TIGR02999 family)
MPQVAKEHVTRVLRSVRDGTTSSEAAAGELLPLVYDELRRLAHARLRQEPAGQTLQATALVHEVYLRLVGDEDPGWNGRAHFFGAAARAMRRILVERARGRARLKRGGGLSRETWIEPAALESDSSLELLALDEALDRLAVHDARKSEVVLLRHFAGLELAEIASALGISLATAKTDWSYAKAWLHRELVRGTEPDSGDAR